MQKMRGSKQTKSKPMSPSKAHDSNKAINKQIVHFSSSKKEHKDVSCEADMISISDQMNDLTEKIADQN